MKISKFRAMILLGELRQQEEAAKVARESTKGAHLNRAQTIRDALADDGWEIVTAAYTVRRMEIASPARNCPERCDCDVCRPELYV